MSTFMPDSYLHYIAVTSAPVEHQGLTAGTMRALAEIHRHRGELLSAEQYEEMADAKEANGGEKN